MLASAECRKGEIEFVLEQVSHVPWPLRIGIVAATLIFKLQLFAARSISRERKPLTEAWRSSQLRMCRDVMKFYSALFLLWRYSKLDCGGFGEQD